MRSAVIAAIQAVPGVVAVDLDRFSGGNKPDDWRLLADGPSVIGSTVLGAELLVLAANPLDHLSEMS